MGKSHQKDEEDGASARVEGVIVTSEDNRNVPETPHETRQRRPRPETEAQLPQPINGR